MIYQGSAKHEVAEIAIHCSDTFPSWMLSNVLAPANVLQNQVAEIRRWHIHDRHWKDIAYHWLIGRTGLYLPGRKETTVGAGIMGHNQGVIHCCLIGGHDSTDHDQFSKHFTPAQEATLLQLIYDIGQRTKIRLITGHNDYAPKACPGFKVAPWLATHGGPAAVLKY